MIDKTNYLKQVINAITIPIILLLVCSSESLAIHRGGKIKIGHLAEIKSLDSQKALDPISRTVVSLVQDGLYEVGEDGKVYPILAADYPQAQSEGRYLIPLRQEIYFHNGEKFTAEDVVFTFKRLNEPYRKTPARSLFQVIESVTAVDEYMVGLTLKRPYPYLEQLLARFECYPLCSSFVSERQRIYGEVTIMGTGAYTLSYFKPGDAMKLNSNVRYWMTPNMYNLIKKGLPLPKRFEEEETEDLEPVEEGTEVSTSLPYPNAISFIQYNGDFNLLDALKKRIIHVAMGWKADNCRELKGIGLKWHDGSSNLIEQIYFNTKNAPFDNIALRKAISMGIDRKALVEDVFCGHAEVAHSPLPSWTWASESEFTGQIYHPEEATAILSEIGYDQNYPFIFTLMCTDEWIFKKQAYLIRDQLERLPVCVELRPLPKKQLFNIIYGEEGTEKSEFQAALEDWQDYRGGIQPYQFVTELYHSQSPKNKTGYSSVDNSIDYLKEIETKAMLRQAFHDLEKIITGDYSTVYLSFPSEIYTTTPPVAAIEWSQMGYLNLRAAWIY